MSDSKIKHDNSDIGKNIRQARKNASMGQTEMAVKLQLMGVDMTREALVKIERGKQHIYASQLKAIRDLLGVSYDDLLK